MTEIEMKGRKKEEKITRKGGDKEMGKGERRKKGRGGGGGEGGEEKGKRRTVSCQEGNLHNWRWKSRGGG